MRNCFFLHPLANPHPPTSFRGDDGDGLKARGGRESSFPLNFRGATTLLLLPPPKMRVEWVLSLWSRRRTFSPWKMGWVGWVGGRGGDSIKIEIEPFLGLVRGCVRACWESMRIAREKKEIYPFIFWQLKKVRAFFLAYRSFPPMFEKS